ncbi:gag/pol protein [Cucumis melo var. makuwa]|uniref:Gag/pol protein n=1 Tax=Cucumis melo var. makuwa TaxID=1194695 RepID=A0A5D3DD25_CUCMM|nr:gag/pol protein [Cucumis melo var. makuwa]
MSLNPASNANRASRKAYDRWIKANEKVRVYILASMSDILAKKHESLATTEEIIDSLKGMFGQPEWSLRHEAIKYIYTKRMKKGTSIREHVLDMMMHFNIAEVNGGVIDEANQVSFILESLLESLPKSFIPFQTNASLNKIEFNLTILLNELQRFQNLTKERLRRRKRGRLLSRTKVRRLQKKETSSWKRLSEGEITLKVRTGEMVSAKAVGDLKIGRLVKSGLLNFCGLMNVKARKGYEYFISFVDDYSRYGHVYLIQNKSDSFEKFKVYEAKVENESGKTIKTFRSDRGGEYMDLRFQDYLIEYGIQSQLSAPSTPQQSGVSERRNRTLLDMVRSMMSFAQLPDSFWGYALETVIYILNNVPSKSVFEIPYELWKGRKGNLRHLGFGDIQHTSQIIIPDDGIEDPLTFKQTMNDVDSNQWIKAMDLEMESMYSNSVWTLVDQPNDMDVKTAFLNGNLEESIYMVQLEGFIQKGQEQKVCHLTDIKKWLATQFQMKDLGNAQYVLGIQIVRNRKNKTLAMSQTSYIDKMLSRYKMQNSIKGLLSYRYGIHLSKEQCPKTPQEVKDMSNIPYASVVGSLIYQSNPGRDHWTAVKNILKYLRRTKDYMLVYGSKDLILTGYTDSDFQTDKDARKSTSGSVFTLNGGAVVWRSIQQSCIADSTMEVEYVAACEAAKEAVWLKKFLTDLEVVPNMHLPITIYFDNSGAVANSREPRSPKRGKHIKRKYHLIREIVYQGDVTVTKISSEQNMADQFTKAFVAKVFESHLHGLGLRGL